MKTVFKIRDYNHLLSVVQQAFGYTLPCGPHSNNRCRWTKIQRSKVNGRGLLGTIDCKHPTQEPPLLQVCCMDLGVVTCGYSRHSGALMVLHTMYLVSPSIPSTAHHEPLIVP